MAYATSEHAVASPSLVSALNARIAKLRNDYMTYRQKRDVYLRTLRELQSYRPHELHDLGVQTADFEELARRQAGL